MKTITKTTKSEIVKNSYTYPTNREKILPILDIEQQFFCAYTEEYLSPAFSRDIEHFDPSLKNTVADGYSNWFSVSSRVNRKKGSIARWIMHQPILHPTNIDIERRLLYRNGYYILANIKDKEAKNLKDFLFLNELNLPQERKNYISTLKEILKGYKNNLSDLERFLKNNRNMVKYRTAIKAEFGIEI